jgi:uncharacterized repeat protein (TIGR01451 family)
MTYYVVVSSDTTYRPSRWQWLIIAIGALLLCSCQSAVRPSDSAVGFIVGDGPLGDAPSLAEQTVIRGDETVEIGAPIIYGNRNFRVADRPAPIADARGMMETSNEGYTYIGDSSPPLGDRVIDHGPYSSGEEPFAAANLRRDDSAAVNGGHAYPSFRPNRDTPWGEPYDEYVCDGADSAGRVVIRKDFSVKTGLDPSDTVAHYDTISGRTEVEPSTKACIYSPRFAAARKIVRVQTQDSIVSATPVTARQQIVARSENIEAGQVKLPEAVHQQIDNTIGLNLQQDEPTRLKENTIQLAVMQEKLLPFENLEIVRSGVFEQRESSLVEEAAAAAGAWSSAEGVQVALQGMPAFLQQANAFGQETLLYEVPPGDPQLRLVKLASKSSATSGETVRFTIRFDNTGDEAIGNVTIIDNLPARLEYVPDSDSCSMNHTLISEFNDVGSKTIRCEIIDPLEPGEGGILRFECLVR